MMTIEELEIYCKNAYESENSDIRSRAEQACLSLSDSLNGLELSRLLFERANSQYSQLVALSTLSKLVGKSELGLSVVERLEIRNQCLNRLLQRDGLADFVVRAAVALVCRITKLGWLDTAAGDGSDCGGGVVGCDASGESCGQVESQGGQRFVFRELLQPLLLMLGSGQPVPMLVSAQILHGLVFEFNQSYEGEITRSTIVMRKIANNFREHQLYSIFSASIELLGKMSASIKSLNLYDNMQHAIVQYSLKLTLACLSYDFIGTCGGEEVSDDMMSVQVPTSWRQAFLCVAPDTPDPVPLLFRLYECLPSSLAHLTLACLVQTASFRRSFFNNNERQVFLGQLVTGVCEILSGNRNSLEDSSCYHELCRLVCRLKSNFQLGELVSLPCYPRFIELLAEFTVRSLESCDSNDSSHSNSQHYLLLTWQRLVASLPYLRCNQQPHRLDTHCPAVLDAYVRSRLRSVANDDKRNGSDIADDGEDNGIEGDEDDWCDLEENVSVSQELESVSVMSRCQYSATVARLAALFDEASSDGGQGHRRHRLRQLAWLVLLMGACVGGRAAGGSMPPGDSRGGSADDHDRLDGELVARVLRLAGSITPNGRHRSALAQLEAAVVSFLDQLRRVYLCGESCVRAARLYDVLGAALALPDEPALLGAIICKLLLNLRVWAGLSRGVVARSLALLHELSLGAVAKRLLRLPVVLALLHDPSAARIPFLRACGANPLDTAFGGRSWDPKSINQSSSMSGAGLSSGISSSRTTRAGLSGSHHVPLALAGGAAGMSSNCRSSFHASLTRLFLLSPRADEPSVFLEFMAPLSADSDSLSVSLASLGNSAASMATGNGPSSNSSEVQQAKLALLALIRDVRGVATACHSKVAFQTLFDWLYPAVLAHLIIAIDLWGPTEPLGVALGCLKLAGELSLSRNNRLQPQVASPSGELMFRVCSRILICYGDKTTHERLSQIRSNKSQYLLYIKEATACIDILRNLMTGNYVNLGAFSLYADDSLEKCLHIFLQLMVSIPPEDMMSYPKLARSYYCLADTITQDHLIWLGTKQPQMILYFINTVCDGLTATSLAVSSSCCSSLDNVVSFLLRLAQSRQAASSGEGQGTRPRPPPMLHSMSLSAGVRTAVDQFLMTADHLSRRDAESRDTYCRLMESPDGQLMALLTRSMDSLFQALMQPECKNQWAMSRPLLGLILLNNTAFQELQRCYISAATATAAANTASASQRESIKISFDKLMEDVNCSLSIRNRDKFTQNLNTFRHNLNGNNKLNIDYHSSNSIEMIA